MNQFTVTVPPEANKMRLDKFLSGNMVEFSRSRIQSLIEQKAVTINGKVQATANYKVVEGDNIEIILPEARSNTIKPSKNIDVAVVYEDDDLMVINKQAGLTVHPGAGNYDDTLVNALIERLGDNLSSINGVLRPGIVHRLDRDTSGLMLIAKTDAAHKHLSAQLKAHEVKRIYHALVWNCPLIKIGKIEANIARSKVDRKRMSIYKTHGKNAITHYTVLHSYFSMALALLECRLETGRTHQIRVHMEHKKMPLVGDKTYGGQLNIKKLGLITSKKAKTALLSFSRQALHAKRIEFTHPTTEELMQFEVDYPEDFKELLKLMKN